MARIRADLDGSVFLHASTGPVVLVAGDEVPEGFVVGAHLLADEADDDEGEVVDESGDPDASQGPELEVEPGPADDGEGDQPEPARPKRTRGPAKA